MAARYNPGVVRDAIKASLDKAGRDGCHMSELYEAVNKAVGQDVPKSSIRSYLNINTPYVFERTGRGHYRIRGR